MGANESTSLVSILPPRTAGESEAFSARPLAPPKRLRVGVVGVRGFPDIQGGIETYCASIYPYLARLGDDVVVFTRKPYVATARWVDGVETVPLRCPRSKNLEMVVHSFIAVIAACRRRVDLVHIQGIGPSLAIPLARALGMTTVVRHVGADYTRAKWRPIARWVLRLGERIALRQADAVVCITDSIATEVRRTRADIVTIPNGVSKAQRLPAGEVLERFGLVSGRYVLAVGRIVPEKGHLDLIDAFENANLPNGWKLVLAGAEDYPSTYSTELFRRVDANPRIVRTGGASHAQLDELYSNAGVFVLPSHHEGMSFALLEAMSFGLRCLASDISANREVGVPREQRYPVGDVAALQSLLLRYTSAPMSSERRRALIESTTRDHDWESIAEDTQAVFHAAIARRHARMQSQRPRARRRV